MSGANTYWHIHELDEYVPIDTTLTMSDEEILTKSEAKIGVFGMIIVQVYLWPLFIAHKVN